MAKSDALSALISVVERKKRAAAERRRLLSSPGPSEAKSRLQVADKIKRDAPLDDGDRRVLKMKEPEEMPAKKGMKKKKKAKMGGLRGALKGAASFFTKDDE